MPLHRLPTEILQHIAYLLVAQTPLGPPAELGPLRQTCRVFAAVFNDAALLARIFRLKFDDGAVTRRSFVPTAANLAEQLVHACTLLRALRGLRQADDDDMTETHLQTAYLLMLDNDGKNYAQLEHAGIDAYVAKYVQDHLWDGQQGNEGWPRDTPESSYALWLMWMTVNRQKLVEETMEQRESMVRLILPYVLLPQRYSAAHAPPNHFHLPLRSRNPLHQPPKAYLNFSTIYYPIYRDNNAMNVPHFGARHEMGCPLVTVAAKLLFVARREVFPIKVPMHLPPGLTAADYADLNSGFSASVPRGARWDWGLGHARAVNVSATDKDDVVRGFESEKWDTEWWRRILCNNIFSPRPRFLPGLVYKPGCMKGSWRGRIYIPRGNLFNRMFLHTAYPGVDEENHHFSEHSLGLIMQPIFLTIEEYHRICGCPSYTHLALCSSTHRTASTLPESDGCGIIPVPSPTRLIVSSPVEETIAVTVPVAPSTAQVPSSQASSSTASSTSPIAGPSSVHHHVAPSQASSTSTTSSTTSPIAGPSSVHLPVPVAPITQADTVNLGAAINAAGDLAPELPNPQPLGDDFVPVSVGGGAGAGAGKEGKGDGMVVDDEDGDEIQETITVAPSTAQVPSSKAFTSQASSSQASPSQVPSSQVPTWQVSSSQVPSSQASISTTSTSSPIARPSSVHLPIPVSLGAAINNAGDFAPELPDPQPLGDELVGAGKGKDGKEDGMVVDDEDGDGDDDGVPVPSPTRLLVSSSVGDTVAVAVPVGPSTSQASSSSHASSTTATSAPIAGPSSEGDYAPELPNPQPLGDEVVHVGAGKGKGKDDEMVVDDDEGVPVPSPTRLLVSSPVEETVAVPEPVASSNSQASSSSTTFSTTATSAPIAGPSSEGDYAPELPDPQTLGDEFVPVSAVAGMVVESDEDSDDDDGDTEGGLTEMELEMEEGEGEGTQHDVEMAEELEEEELEEEEPKYLDRVDFSMNNAWFPGVVGGVGFVKRKANDYAGPSTSSSSSEPASSSASPSTTNEPTPAGRRDEAVFGVDYAWPSVWGTKRGGGGCVSTGASSATGASSSISSSTTSTTTTTTSFTSSATHASAYIPPYHPQPTSTSTSSHSQTQTPSSPSPSPSHPPHWVYETYDPARRSSHDPSTCLRCGEWETRRREERAREERQVKRALERRARAAVGGNKNKRRRVDDEEKQKKKDQPALDVLERLMSDVGNARDEEMEIQEMDVSEFGFFEDESEYEPEDDSLKRKRSYDILGDDLPHGQPPAPPHPRTRRIFTRTRVGLPSGCTSGIRDTLLTGTTDPLHAAWHPSHPSRLYGRVRPWDGLVGMLRITEVPHVSYMFVCGYVVGEGNFVGEWRMAGTDPLRPSWGSAFVMSRSSE